MTLPVKKGLNETYALQRLTIPLHLRDNYYENARCKSKKRPIGALYVENLQ